MAAFGRQVWTASKLVSLSLLALAAASACGGNKADENGSTIPITNTAATGAGGGAATSAGSSSTPGGTPGTGPDLVTGGTPAATTGGQGGVGGGCAATFVQAKPKTLAMFIMLDQSLSMNEIVNMSTNTTRWDAVTSAFSSFVTNPATADLLVGLQYFGLEPKSSGTGGSGAGGAGGTGGAAGSGGAAGAAGRNGGFGGRMGGGGPFGVNVSCEASDYATAEVAIAPLSMNSKAITDSMAAHDPLTTTPTLPAMQGGVQFASKYAEEHPDHKVILVLATDGEPSGCNSTLDNTTAAAKAGLDGTPSIQTYVIGVGSNLTNLDAIAAAGGTTKAFLVSDANVQTDLIKALQAIQGAEVPCEYSVPLPAMGKNLDFGKVNVQYTPTTGAEQVLQKVDSAAQCKANSQLWYYDNNTAPTQILLCEDTCEQLTTAGAGKLEIVLDCKDTVKVPE